MNKLYYWTILLIGWFFFCSVCNGILNLILDIFKLILKIMKLSEFIRLCKETSGIEDPDIFVAVESRFDGLQVDAEPEITKSQFSTDLFIAAKEEE